MATIKLTPSQLAGSVSAVPSKSILHRMLICASLASGTSVIHNASKSQDILATIGAMRSLGASIEMRGSDITVVGIGGSEVAKIGDIIKIDCLESGSTMRFLMSILATMSNKFEVTGSPRLAERGCEEIVRCLSEAGAKFSSSALPLTITPTNLSGKILEIGGEISSQYLSGLLMALPRMPGSHVRLSGSLASRDYALMTRKIMRDYGAKTFERNGEYTVKGEYKAHEYSASGDYSNSAFLLALGAVSGSVTVTGLDKSSPQGDKRFISLLRKMGGKVIVKGDTVTAKKSKLKAIDIDVRDIPDLMPALSVLLAVSEGVGKIYNGERLRMKESDRISAMANNLSACGVKVECHVDGLTITGGSKLNSAELCGYNDHRIVMASSVLASVTGGDCLITDSEAVAKSYPNYWEDFVSIGGKISEL